MRITTFVALAAVTVTGLWVTGCGGYSSYVDTEDAALGRVVVYRNGIAYFERRAHVDGDRLSMRVPHDKVDDFLKSLTVADARTGKPWPVSFPTRAAASDGTVEMVVQLPQSGSHDLVLSYITEAPAWKPSYRLVVGDDGKVNVQGWAVVDNTSGEDWKAVRLGVGSSSALSFRYDLRTVRLVHRETLSPKEQFAKAPPLGGSVHGGDAGSGPNVVGVLADADIPRPAEHPDLEDDVTAMPSAGESAGRPAEVASARRSKDGRYWGNTQGAALKKERERRLQANARASAQVVALARKLQQGKHTIVIEGYADKSERDQKSRSFDRANVLRNELINQGVAPARLVVRSKGYVAGNRAGVRLVAAAPPAGGKSKTEPATDDDGNPIGESHFESRSHMTVKRGTSAMVSILDNAAKGTVVYLYDAEAKRGDARFAFKAVRFVNPTESTLESGPVTVYGSKRFIGEGLSEPIPPHATAFVPFAMDRQVVVDRKGSTADRISQLVTVQRGVLTAEVQHTRRTELKITSRLHKPTITYVRHTVRKGWELTRSPKLSEKLGEAHLFAIALAPGETKTVVVEEATPITKTINLRSPIGLEMVRVFLKTPREDKRFEEPMKRLMKLHTEMANVQQTIESVRERMEDFRARLDELQVQIANLKDLKGGGRLLRHLKNKTIEISNRLQKSTIEVVDLQEKLMVAKIRFQDGVAELSLGKVATASAKR